MHYNLTLAMQLPSEIIFKPTREDLDAFNGHKKTISLGTSGSSWGLKQLQHSYVHFKSNLEALQLLKIQNLVPENSIIADHFQKNLSADWQEILKSCMAGNTQHSFSPLDCALGELASLARSEGSYHSSSSVEPQSSPPINRSPFETSLEYERKTQRALEPTQTPSRSPGSSIWSSPPKLPSSPLARYSTSDLSPPQRKATSQQSSHPASSSRMITPSTDMASAPRFALLEQPTQPRMLSDSTASLEMDLDKSESQSGDAHGSLDWNHQPKLPSHTQMPERRDREYEQADKAPSSSTKLVPYPNSSSTGQSSPSANSNISVSSRYNFGLDPVHEEDKPEPEVEYVARLFMKVVMNAIMVAASSAKGSSPGQWVISHDIASVYLAALSPRERAKHFEVRNILRNSK